MAESWRLCARAPSMGNRWLVIKSRSISATMCQRKVLTPNDFNSLAEVEHRLLAFQRHYQSLARPFTWTFTRRDLARLLATLALQTSHSIAA